jgi:anti-sigma factor (TIGR02949 family)
LYEYLDNELTDDVVTRIRTHLSVCEHCFDKFEFEKHLNEYVSRSGRVEVDSAPLRARVMEGIRELDEEDLPEGFFYKFRPYLAAAAAVVLVVIGLVFVLNGGRSTAYAKVKPLIENHKKCLHDRVNGDGLPMDESAIRACVSGFLSDPDILFQPASDRLPVFGDIVSCPQCRAAHVAFEYAETEVSIFIFEDHDYTPPDEYEIVRASGHDFHRGSLDGMNVIFWRCKGCWCAAVATLDFADIISFASIY